jgi:hypothetical protein
MDALEGLSLVVVALAMLLVKAGGYAIAGALLARRVYRTPTVVGRALGFAATRTVAGMVVSGILVGLTSLLAVILGGAGDVGAIVLFAFGVIFQLTARIALSGVLVVAFFDRARAQLGKDATATAGLVVWSYVLDLPNYLMGFGELAFLLRDLRIC